MRAWIQGSVVQRDAPLARAPHGPGVFETLRAEGGTLFFLDAHLERLERGARALALPWPPPFDPRVALFELLAALGPGEHALRLSWERAESGDGLLAVEPRPLAPLPSPLRVLVDAPGATPVPGPPGVKTTARAGYDALRAEARRRGAFEALVCTRAGERVELVEGTVTNLFVARGDELATPPLSSGALPGVVRTALVAALAHAPIRDRRGRSVRLVERPLTVLELARAQEVLLTNSLVRLAAADALEGEGARRDDLPGARGPLAEVLRSCILELEARSGSRACFPGGAGD